MKKRLTKVRDLIGKKNATLQELRDKIDEQAKTISTLMETIAGLNGRIQALNAKCADRDKLLDENIRLDRKIEELEDEIHDLETSLEK